MEKMVLVCLKNLCLILISIIVMWNQFLIMMFETCAVPPHTEINPLILYYKVIVHVYIIIVCIVFVINLFRNHSDDSVNHLNIIVHTLLIIIDIVVSIQIIYDIMLFMSSEPFLAIIMIISLGFMIWHIKDSISVLERSKNDSPLEEL